MNKNYNIIHINSLTGIIVVLLLISGFICGFILLPVWVVKNIWNMLVGQMLNGPIIQYYQAALLWVLIALGLYMNNKNAIRIRRVKSDIDPSDKNNIEIIMKEDSDND
ncbi:MAG: hypothetical protein WCK67_10765 [bacterium]